MFTRLNHFFFGIMDFQLCHIDVIQCDIWWIYCTYMSHAQCTGILSWKVKTLEITFELGQFIHLGRHKSETSSVPADLIVWCLTLKPYGN